METPTPLTTSPGSNRNWTGETPRVKILCSFNGSILPRPQDGKLRYVGGETRIVSVRRDIGFEELMGKMKELFEGVSCLKYKQPDEELDALVSVVDDDDVVNMMEECDKLGNGDGVTRLRLFLFSNSEVDCERRYVDALNSPSDSPVDDAQLTEQYFNRFNLEMGVTPVNNLHHLTIPQHQMEPTWSPAYYSPRLPGSEFLSPPSCSSYHGYYGNRLSPVDHQSQSPENVCDYCPPLFTPRFHIRDANDSRPLYMGPTAYPDGQHMPLPYGQYDDRSHYIRHRHEFGNELYHDQGVPQYGNYPYAYANSNSLWGDVHVQSPLYGSPSNEALVSPQQDSRFKNPLVESPPQLAGYSGVDVPDCYPVRPLKLVPNSYNLEPVQSSANLISCSNPKGSMVGFDHSPNLVDCKDLPSNIMNNETIQNTTETESLSKIERSELNPEKGEIEAERLSYVPQIVESVKKVALESDKEVKGEAQEGVESATGKAVEVTEETTHELDVVDAPEDLELDSDTGTESNSRIEPTKAEEEAIARGLQTIRNDDLEEIRQLGSGTYGAVYHGKWKGSDVAIKRIKASCFSGKPTERERMIADFWKEALMLSSLHHPNVVSFYGIVRDGPDGSLATVTEYMINGSLKQFLKKKDRTIDRRKRLIIAMDTAFGMEYLHAKNVVHFDLKCENLLVNMRDPHRPICKIGDLGLSKVKQHTMVSGGVRGTLPWMAPELLSGKSHMVTEKIDVYSFGVVMWELLTGDEPYTDMHCAAVIGGIVNNTLRPTIPTWCDPEWKSLMESCWSADPQERPSFLEISQKLRTMAAAIKLK